MLKDCIQIGQYFTQFDPVTDFTTPGEEKKKGLGNIDESDHVSPPACEIWTFGVLKERHRNMKKRQSQMVSLDSSVMCPGGLSQILYCTLPDTLSGTLWVAVHKGFI